MRKKIVSFFARHGIRQLGILFDGFIFWLPITVIILVLLWFGGYAEDFGKNILKQFVAEQHLFTGSGFILVILIFYLTGRFKIKEKILSKIPGIGIFFQNKKGSKISLKDLFNLQPCVFLLSPTTPSYGWLMKEQKVTLILGEERKSVRPWIHVYMPNVPTMITGQIYPIKKGCVIKLGNSSQSVFKALLYNSEIPEELLLLPWEDENHQEFEKRAELFGSLINRYGIINSPSKNAD